MSQSGEPGAPPQEPAPPALVAGGRAPAADSVVLRGADAGTVAAHAASNGQRYALARGQDPSTGCTYLIDDAHGQVAGGCGRKDLFHDRGELVLGFTGEHSTGATGVVFMPDDITSVTIDGKPVAIDANGVVGVKDIAGGATIVGRSDSGRTVVIALPERFN